MNNQVLLKEGQAAEFLGLSDNTLRDWRWRNQGPPYIRLSAKCIRYDKEQLGQWLREKTEQPKNKDKAQCPKNEGREQHPQ